MPPKKEPPVATVYKKIALRSQIEAVADSIRKQFTVSSLSARILAARGFSPDDTLRHYIAPTLKEGLTDPSTLRGAREAATLIADVAAQGKPIAVCCDFDVDGLTGGSQMVHFLRSAGVKVVALVPDRFKEGYGLNERIVREAKARGCELLIAIDFGTTNEAQISLARKIGLKTIVIDHHHVGNHAPKPDVFINPHQPGCGFCGATLCAAGLVWHVLVVLRGILAGAEQIDVREYLDLACLGTICDMVPLLGANRVIARKGLEIISERPRVGVKALKESARVFGTVSCGDVSFLLGPRINAAGRMMTGERVIELLTTDDQFRAVDIANQLNELNLERQETEAAVKANAEAMVEKFTSLPHGIVVWDEGFHTGVVGIVAQRLVERFYRPTAVAGLGSEDVFKGSVRGIRGASVVKILQDASRHLLGFGGHDGAGGFSVHRDNIQQFSIDFDAACRKHLKGIELVPVSEADTEASLGELSVDVVRELDQLAPFGIGNPSPQLLLRNMRVHQVKKIKDAHTKAIITDGKRYLTTLMWRSVNHPALVERATVDIVLRPEISTYQGVQELQGTIQAVERR